MSHQLTFADLPNATSLPGLASGRMRCDKQDGTTTDLSGLDHAHANLSPRQAQKKGLLMSGTFGRTGFGLSSSAALTRSLVSKLQEQVRENGSTLWAMTWKESDLGSGRVLPLLVVSVPRTSGGGCTGWPTPVKADSRGRAGRADHKIAELPNAVELAGWPTPKKTNNGRGEDPEAKKKRGMNPGLEQADAARLCTPKRLTVTGEMLTGSFAGTISGGLLNPELSRWLMGIPSEWDSCGVTAMHSVRLRRQVSSKAT